LVVVVDQVLMRGNAGVGGFAAVGAIALPVIHHVVPHVGVFAVRAVVAGSVEARVPAVVVRDQVMMETGSEAAPNATITVRTLVVDGIAQAFGDEAPLHGEAGVVIGARGLVDGPGKGAVIYDH